MANPAVDKMKNLALKHGEKAVMSLAMALFLFFLFQAISKKTIELKPEALAEKAKSADSNLSKQQKIEDVLKSITDAGVKPTTDFEQIVNKQQSKALNPGDYIVKSKWVTPEPGAGLIRDQPELIAVEDLYAFPNRGGYLVFELNSKGERIVDYGKDKTSKKKMRLGRVRRGGGGMMGGGNSGSMMGMGSMMAGGGGTAKQKKEAEDKANRDAALLNKSLVGKANDEAPAKDDAAKKAEAAAAPAVQVNYKETVKGYRSVVITGTLDNKKLKENYLAALKDPAIAYPNYRRLDVQRQTRLPNGTWTPFANVDSEANFSVLDNLPEVDEELVPGVPGPRLEALVDPLPFPYAGNWAGVHIAKLVPKERREIAKPGAGGMPGMMMGGSAPGMMMGGSNAAMDSTMGGRPPSGMMAMGGSSAGMDSSMKGAGMMAASSASSSSSGSGGMGKMGGMGMGMPSSAPTQGEPADVTDFEKSESDDVMIRSLDFTVKPDTTYRYKVRIVVFNPNYNRSDVSPGTDTTAEELKGPWSEPSPEVTVPADIAAYAMAKAKSGGRRHDQVTYQVVRWNPEDGNTVIRTDDAGPGELIGTPATAEVPESDGTGEKRILVDFNSRRFVVDAMGGLEPLASSYKAGPNFEVPALSLTLRPDATVVIQGQPFDTANDVRIEMERNYKQEIKDSKSKKRREPGMMGMMGSSSGGSGR